MPGLHRTNMVFVATNLKMAKAIVPFSTVAPLKKGCCCLLHWLLKWTCELIPHMNRSSPAYLPSLINATRPCFDCCTWDYLKICSWCMLFTFVTHTTTHCSRDAGPYENMENTLQMHPCEATGSVCIMTHILVTHLSGFTRARFGFFVLCNLSMSFLNTWPII